MRTETLLHICEALNITPDEIPTEEVSVNDLKQNELFEKLNKCTNKEIETALRLLSVFLQSL